MPSIALPDRAIITVGGADASSFLQALITTDLAPLAEGEAVAGALLTPQGKILFSFLISTDGASFRLETSNDQAEALMKRLTLYRLRAAVTLTLDAPVSVLVLFGTQPEPGSLVDARFAKAGHSVWRLTGEGPRDDNDTEGYERLRIGSGIVEAGADYALQDAFPHDVLLDLNGGLSFRKGCYVGQEVVSRMHHRSTARKRVVVLTGDSELPAPGTSVTADGRNIGTLGSTSGVLGLAILRIDKAGEAIHSDIPLRCGEATVVASLPAWTGLSFPAQADEAVSG